MTTQLKTLLDNLDNLLSGLDTGIESDIDAFSNDNNVNTVKLLPNNVNTRWSNLKYSDYCCLRCRGKDTIRWTECDHRYCQNCISNIINENVSLKNEIPQCPKCNQSLNIQKVTQDVFKYSYPKKYKITLTFKQYTHMNKLIRGYIRRIQTIPNEIILIIFDFYHLNYVKPIKCNICIKQQSYFPSDISSDISFIDHMNLSDAYKLTICDKIDHRDMVGRFLAATIIDKQGINLKIHYDGWSHKWDVWSDFSGELYRFAKYESISKRAAHRFKTLQPGSYIDIHPRRKHIGWRYAEIRRIDKQSGQIQVVYEYNNTHYLYWMHLDNKYEIAPFTTMCKNKNYIPDDCNLCVLALDFRQLCNKQKLCIKCNEFYPIHSIIFWYKCNHILCIECFMKCAKSDIMQNKIPICPTKNCHNDIAPNEYEYQDNISFLLNSWEKSNEHRRFIYTVELGAKLRLLLFRKDKFECSICNKWHPNIDLFPDKNKNCQHKYTNECYTYLTVLSNCGHSDCLKCISQCEICHKFDENKQLLGWTKCGHKYHKYCAKKYINEWIVPHQTMLSKLKLNTSDMIPLCIHKNCNKLLDMMSAELMGVTDYQYNMLYEIRKQSILIKMPDKRICYNTYKYKTTNKTFLVNQDFSSVAPIDIYHNKSKQINFTSNVFC